MISMLNTPNTLGFTILNEAVISNQLDVVRYLIDCGCELNPTDNREPPLITACQEGFVDCAKLLIDRGADVNLGEPLLWSLDAEDDDMIDLLLQCGAKTDCITEPSGRSLIKASLRRRMKNG